MGPGARRAVPCRCYRGGMALREGDDVNVTASPHGPGQCSQRETDGRADAYKSLLSSVTARPNGASQPACQCLASRALGLARCRPCGERCAPAASVGDAGRVGNTAVSPATSSTFSACAHKTAVLLFLLRERNSRRHTRMPFFYICCHIPEHFVFCFCFLASQRSCHAYTAYTHRVRSCVLAVIPE